MQNILEHFIVVEGLDGAGTTTQTKKLHEYFTQNGVISFATREPTDGPLGKFIRDLLSGGVTPAEDGARYAPGEREMALLFAADRLEHSRTLAAKLDDGARVVCDRYIFSSMAYQTLDPSISAQWVTEINRGCVIPNVTFLLTVPVGECLRRISLRNEKATVYEKRDLLEAINQNYEQLAPYYQEHFGPLVTIDGTKSESEVHAQIVEALQTHLGT
jgi:dTMP kinase